MKRYLMPVVIILVFTSGLLVGCAAGLPNEEKEVFHAMGYQTGYDWGYWLTAENKDRTDLFWTAPDKVQEVQKLYPEVNIRDAYIPKGYWMVEDVSNAHFPDGTPFNDKQKKQAMEAYNWGFYDGFFEGAHDYLDGNPHRFLP